jgi:small subunit ribosomal protein S9
VRIYKGKKDSTVNGKALSVYFGNNLKSDEIFEPFSVTGIEDMYFTAKTVGGGFTGQHGAIILGLARALVKYDESLKPALRKAGLLTRDSRMVERKKYNHDKARKKAQFSKR